MTNEIFKLNDDEMRESIFKVKNQIGDERTIFFTEISRNLNELFKINILKSLYIKWQIKIIVYLKTDLLNFYFCNLTKKMSKSTKNATQRFKLVHGDEIVVIFKNNIVQIIYESNSDSNSSTFLESKYYLFEANSVKINETMKDFMIKFSPKKFYEFLIRKLETGPKISTIWSPRRLMFDLNFDIPIIFDGISYQKCLVLKFDFIEKEVATSLQEKKDCNYEVSELKQHILILKEEIEKLKSNQNDEMKEFLIFFPLLKILKMLHDKRKETKENYFGECGKGFELPTVDLLKSRYNDDDFVQKWKLLSEKSKKFIAEYVDEYRC